MGPQAFGGQPIARAACAHNTVAAAQTGGLRHLVLYLLHDPTALTTDDERPCGHGVAAAMLDNYYTRLACTEDRGCHAPQLHASCWKGRSRTGAGWSWARSECGHAGALGGRAGRADERAGKLQ